MQAVRFHRWRIASVAVAFLASAVATVSAQDTALSLSEFASCPRIDGLLTDWHGASFVQVGNASEGMRFAVGRCANTWVVAAEVFDGRWIREPRASAQQDAVVLELFHDSGASQAIWFFPGDPGRQRSRLGRSENVHTRPSDMNGTIVEAEGDESILLEASFAVPRGADGEGARALHVRAIQHDVDSAAHPDAALRASYREEGLAAPLLRVAGNAAQNPFDAFRAQHGIGSAARARIQADLTGDTRSEEFAVLGDYVVVSGPGFLDGHSYAYLPVPIASSEARTRALDVTCDGKAEVLLQLESSNPALRIVAVYHLERDLQLLGVFELMRREPSLIESELREINHRCDNGAQGFDLRLSACSGATFAGTVSRRETFFAPLSHAGPIREEDYRWNGSAFSLVRSEPNRSWREAEVHAPSVAAAPDHVAAAPAFDVDTLLRAAMPAVGIAEGARATQRLSINVAGDRAPEIVVAFRSRILVFGANFRGGTGWGFVETPGGDDALRDFRVIDLNGDGRAEFVSRIRETLANDTQRDMLLVQSLDNERVVTLLQRDIAVYQGGRRVENSFSTQHGLEITAGSARGFSAQNWPFAPGATDMLLPWSGPQSLHYVVRGSRWVAEGPRR